MSVWHGDLHKRKPTGGKRRPYRGKRKYEMGSLPIETKLGEDKVKISRRKGGNIKIRLVSAKWVNVSDPETGETKRVEILRVMENPANVDYDRRGVITKGCLLETPLGIVKVTSRPGQDGVLNAVLIEKKA
ncbi:MAG: 30S ribosomal protein S8e [Candidatus Bathyarchaeia archaeon]|nr:30S ribosomal protein S8e [Candidatus Bathyarchaeota archaeon]